MIVVRAYQLSCSHCLQHTRTTLFFTCFIAMHTTACLIAAMAVTCVRDCLSMCARSFFVRLRSSGLEERQVEKEARVHIINQTMMVRY